MNQVLILILDNTNYNDLFPNCELTYFLPNGPFHRDWQSSVNRLTNQELATFFESFRNNHQWET